jgi:hypothetical protein
MKTTATTLLEVRDALDSEFSRYLQDRAQACLRELHADYFESIPFEEFCAGHLGHTSIAAKLLAYRFFTTSIFLRLRAALMPTVREIYGEDEVLLQPYFYLRYSFPEMAQSELHRRALLDTQPHYDRALGIRAMSFWLALVDIDEESGGLCCFSGSQAAELFPYNGRNRYNYDAYLEAASALDPQIKSSIVQPAVRAGNMLTFDSDLLHAATKPKTRWRISADFRLVARSAVERSDAAVQRQLDAFNRSPSLCNAGNLILFGDFRGASRQLAGLGPDDRVDATTGLAEILAHKQPDASVLARGGKMAWQAEYGWMK